MKTVSSVVQPEILQQLLENQNRFAKVAKGELYPKTFENFRRRELVNYLKQEKGKKRLRKKKALKRMREIWAFYLLTRPLSHVQSLPGGAKSIYSNHTDNERHRIAEIIRGIIK